MVLRSHAVWIWPIVLAVLVLLTQSGALVHEVLNWDESTFMLLGSDLRDGTLPYIERFDNKPPMIFFIYAGWMSVFGETVMSARLLGDFSMWLIAVTVFLIARRHVDDLAAGAAAALYVSIHAVEPGFHTAAGFPAMAMVMVALYLLLVYPLRHSAVLCAGVLIGIAVLTRTNLAYLALASGLWIAALGLGWPGRFGFMRMSPFIYGAGGLIPLGLILAIFAYGGALHELWLASVEVALSYSKEWETGAIRAGIGHVYQWMHSMSETPLLHGPFLVATLLGVVATLWPRSLARESEPDAGPGLTLMDWALIWVFLISIQWSILQSGSVYKHYWQQFFPLTCLFVAVLIGRLKGHAVWRGLALALVAVPILAGLGRMGPSSVQVLTKPGYATDQYDILAASHILEDMMEPGDRVWALTHHLILQYLDLPTVSRVTAHPSNITRASITTPLEDAGYIQPNELERVMNSLPEFILSNADGHPYYFPDRALIPAYLEAHYELVHATPVITIYKLKQDQSRP